MRARSNDLLLLVLAGFSTILVYGAVAVRLPLFGTVTTVGRTLNAMSAGEWRQGTAIAGCIALLFGAYALGAATVAWAAQARWGRLALLLVPATSAVALVYTFPITSTDVYDYLFRGWMLANYQINPFVATPRALPGEPLLPYVAWPEVVTAYGPLWERISWVTAWVSGITTGPASPDVVLVRLVLGYKLLSLLGVVLGGAAIWAALAGAEQRWRWLGLYLWLWNPLVLWESIGAAHNDVWMALPVVVALWAMRVWSEQRNDLPHQIAPFVALLALTAGGLIKFIAFFLGPLALAAILRATVSWQARLRVGVLGGLGCLLLVVVAYAPFWAGWTTFQNIVDRGALFTSSWLATLNPLLKAVLPAAQANTATSLLGLLLLVGGTLWGTWQVWCVPRAFERQALNLLLWFLLVCNPWFQPWYPVWLVALVALVPWRQRLVWVVCVFCVSALLSYLVGGLVLPNLGLSQPPLARELLMSLFVYVPPLLVLGWPPRRAPALTPVDGSAIMTAVAPP